MRTCATRRTDLRSHCFLAHLLRPISPHGADTTHAAEHSSPEIPEVYTDGTKTEVLGRCASGGIEGSAQAARPADLALSAYDAMLGRDTSLAIGLTELYNLDIDACHVTSRTLFFFLACLLHCVASARRELFLYVLPCRCTPLEIDGCIMKMRAGVGRVGLTKGCPCGVGAGIGGCEC